MAGVAVTGMVVIGVVGATHVVRPATHHGQHLPPAGGEEPPEEYGGKQQEDDVEPGGVVPDGAVLSDVGVPWPDGTRPSGANTSSIT